MNDREIAEDIRKRKWSLMLTEITDDLVTAQIYDEHMKRIALAREDDQEEAMRAAYKKAIGREITLTALELGTGL